MKRPAATEYIKEDLSQRVNRKITASAKKTIFCGYFTSEQLSNNQNYPAKVFFPFLYQI
jgi:hypothetical protein